MNRKFLYYYIITQSSSLLSLTIAYSAWASAFHIQDKFPAVSPKCFYEYACNNCISCMILLFRLSSRWQIIDHFPILTILMCSVLFLCPWYNPPFRFGYIIVITTLEENEDRLHMIEDKWHVSIGSPVFKTVYHINYTYSWTDEKVHHHRF